jgi:hypothetical protein
MCKNEESASQLIKPFRLLITRVLLEKRLAKALPRCIEYLNMEIVDDSMGLLSHVVANDKDTETRTETIPFENATWTLRS